MTNNAVAVLTKAKALVKRGWLQGAAANEDGTQMCAGQALMTAAAKLDCTSIDGISGTLGSAFLIRAARERTDVEWCSIPDWNDTPDRTQEEVLDTFDHAIKLAERDAPLAEQDLEGALV